MLMTPAVGFFYGGMVRQKKGILNKLCQFKNSKISRTRKGIDK